MDTKKESLKVIICRQPGDYIKGEISVLMIENVNWERLSGGVHARQGYFSLYGYIPYSVAKDIVACSGKHDFGYNSAKICICKSHNIGEYVAGYNYLAGLAGLKPKSIIAMNRPAKQPPCTRKILEHLKDKPLARKTLHEIMQEIGYERTTVNNALKILHKQSKIIFDMPRPNPKQLISLI